MTNVADKVESTLKKVGEMVVESSSKENLKINASNKYVVISTNSFFNCGAGKITDEHVAALRGLRKRFKANSKDPVEVAQCKVLDKIFKKLKVTQ